RVRLEHVIRSPATQHRVDSAVPIGSKGPLPAEWQIVVGAGTEDMRGIKKANSVIAAPVVSILPICPLAIGATVPAVAPVVGEHFAESVRCLELQPVTEALPAADLQRIVAHVGTGIRAADIGHQGQNTVLRLTLYRGSPGR